jgi:hypothetical protein
VAWKHRSQNAILDSVKLQLVCELVEQLYFAAKLSRKPGLQKNVRKQVQQKSVNQVGAAVH